MNIVLKISEKWNMKNKQRKIHTSIPRNIITSVQFAQTVTAKKLLHVWVYKGQPRNIITSVHIHL